MQRKSCFRGCLLYGCLTLLVLALPFWYICLYAPPLKISPETTRITGPLTADGQIDYFKALEERIYPPELATDENGFRDFVRLFGFVRSDGMTDFGSFSTSMALGRVYTNENLRIISSKLHFFEQTTLLDIAYFP